MGDITKAIKWFTDRKDKVFYSMTYRRGQIINAAGNLASSGRPGYDCSSAVYSALVHAGFFEPGIWIGNTDSLYGDLEKRGWAKVVADKNGYIATKRGDVFLWGKRGASTGAFGHTGIFTDANNIIHCAFGYNGIHVDDHDWLNKINGYPELTVYRYTGAPAPAVPAVRNETDQVLDIGSTIKFTNTYVVDDLLYINGLHQVRTNALCGTGFTWDDNGIPVQPLVEVDAQGYTTVDQELGKGSGYVIPGKYTVLDLGESNGMWLALIKLGGYNVWVDVASATEIKSTDGGTPVPSVYKPTTTTPVPASPADVKPPETLPNDHKAPENLQENSTKPSDMEENVTPKEAPAMAFSKEQQAELVVATKNAMQQVTAVASSDVATELVESIPKRTKMIVYLVGDTLLGLSAITPQAVMLATNPDPMQLATGLSAVLATAGLFLLTMFGIYKGNK